MRGHTEERSIPRSSLQQLPVASVIAESGRTRLLSSATLVSLGLERVILVGNQVGDCDDCHDDFKHYICPKDGGRKIAASQPSASLERLIKSSPSISLFAAAPRVHKAVGMYSYASSVSLAISCVLGVALTRHCGPG